MTKADVIIGVDEAGRGALAGPVTIAATAFLRTAPPVTAEYHSIRNGAVTLTAADSKSFRNENQRTVLSAAIHQAALEVVIVEKSSREIDERLMHEVFPEALKLAIARCIEQLVHKGVYTDPKQFLVMLDGDTPIPKGIPCEVRPIIDGDKRVWQIGAASIVAKVHRDARMLELHQKYPNYGFDGHKGYPVPAHKKLLKKLGPCPIHRGTFKPVAESRGPIPGFEV